MEWTLDSLTKEATNMWNSVTGDSAPVAPQPEKPQNQTDSYETEEEPDLLDQASSMASAAWRTTSAWGTAQYHALSELPDKIENEVVTAYDSAKRTAIETADKAYTYAKEVYRDHEEIIDAAAPIVLGPINGWIAKEAAEYVLGDEPEATPPPPPTEEPKQRIIIEETDSDYYTEVSYSDDVGNDEDDLNATHARTVNEDGTAYYTGNAEPKDTESTSAKVTKIEFTSASPQPKSAPAPTLTTGQIEEAPKPVEVTQAPVQPAAEAARMTGTEPTKIVEQEKAIASNEPAGATTVTTTASTPPTETQQTDNGSNSSDDGYSDADEGQVGYASGSNSGNLNSSESGLAGLVGDPLGRTGQNSGTASQSAGNNTATNSELAAKAASKMSSESNWSNGTNNSSTRVNTGTQASPDAVASTQPQQSADPRHQPLGVKLPGQDTQNNNDGDTATAPTSSSSAALAAAIAHAGVQQGPKNDSSSKSNYQDSKSSVEVAQADSEKVNGTGNPLENDSGSNQGNPFGNQAETVAALTDLENQFWGEIEDYPVDQIVTKTIFTSASQISTFG